MSMFGNIGKGKGVTPRDDTPVPQIAGPSRSSSFSPRRHSRSPAFSRSKRHRLLAAPEEVSEDMEEEITREIALASGTPDASARVVPPPPTVEDLSEPQWAINIVQEFQNATIIFQNLQQASPGEDTPMVDRQVVETYEELKKSVDELQHLVKHHSTGSQSQWKWLASGCEHFAAQVRSETTITKERIDKLEQVVAAQDAMFRELRTFSAHVLG